MSTLDIVAPQSAALVPAPFQQQVIENISVALLRRPSPPCLLRAPTGSGKTFMLAGVLSRVSNAQPTVWLWFIPFVTLVQQTEDALLSNASGLTPVRMDRGRNQEPVAGTVLLSTAQAVAKAKDRKAGYAADGDDTRSTLDEFIALARARGMNIGLVVDEAHIGLDSATEFGQFAHWLKPEFLIMASATPRDARLDEFLAKAGKGAREAFNVSRAEVVEARLNKRYVEAVVYDLQHGAHTIADLKRTVLRQSWLQHLALKQQLAAAGIDLTPLLLVQVSNGVKTVEEAQHDLMQLCKVPPAAIGTHSADAPDPVMMAAIANDPTKEVLIFKQSAGTGFDAPRAFVLASTKPVNDPDFAMQFIGRVMRVAPAIRAGFPRPTPVPAAFDTAYIYLANAEAQQGFQSAVNTAGAVQSQLEGQTERMVLKQTTSGATIITNRPDPQMPVTYEVPVQPFGPVTHGNDLAEGESSGWQPGLFTPENSGGAVAGGVVMSGDKPPPSAIPSKALPPDEVALEMLLLRQGIKAYRRRVDLRLAPTVLRQESRPVLDAMTEVSRKAASALPISEALASLAVKVACHALRGKEVHIEMTHNARSEVDVEIVTDRAALLKAAESSLRHLPQVEDDDVRIIIETLAQRLKPTVALSADDASTRDEKQLLRLARDAACWIVRKEAQVLGEFMLDAVAALATTEDAQPLPETMLYPMERALKPSRKNLYGVVPPAKEDFETGGASDLSIDAQLALRAESHAFEGGRWKTAAFDGASAINSEEQTFIDSLDGDDTVLWWHRNPDRKPWSVRLVRSEHTNYFYPDFVVCIETPKGATEMTRLIETKHDIKDAARKARRVPKIYGKVLFVTKDSGQLHIVNDDGSLGSRFDWSDLEPAWDWMRNTRQS